MFAFLFRHNQNKKYYTPFIIFVQKITINTHNIQSLYQNIFQMDALKFPRGNYYQLISKANGQALRVQESDQSKYEKSRIVSGAPSSQDNSQIFMIEKVGQGDDEFEIVSCISSLVFEQDSKQIRLRPGKQSKGQLFSVIEVPIQNERWFWIRTDAKGNEGIFLEGILRYGAFDTNNPAFFFKLVPVNNNPTIANSSILINNLSGKALDVPGATFKKGERLVQWELNKRWNQRWVFQKQGNSYLIVSAHNGFALDIAQEKRQNGAKVVQWERAGKTNQLWTFEKSGNNTFKIRSVHEPSAFLAIKKQDVNNGGQLEISTEENPSMYWRIQGKLP